MRKISQIFARIGIVITTLGFAAPAWSGAQGGYRCQVVSSGVKTPMYVYVSPFDGTFFWGLSADDLSTNVKKNFNGFTLVDGERNGPFAVWSGQTSSGVILRIELREKDGFQFLSVLDNLGNLQMTCTK